MTPETTGVDLRSVNIRQIDTSKLKRIHISEASETFFNRFLESQQQMLESRYSALPDTSSHPAYLDYATVRVGGKVVAKFDNNGFMETSNAFGSSLVGQLPGDVNRKTGPVLAQARAEEFARQAGGEVVISSTALTQSQFEALPKLRATIDYAAMQSDPAYEELQRSKQARSEFLAQQMAQSEQPAAETTGGNDAVQAFLDYMSKSPEERYFEAFLEQKGLTPEQFAKLPPDEREKILEEFEQRMEQQAMIGAAESMAVATARKAAATAATPTEAVSSQREKEELNELLS